MLLMVSCIKSEPPDYNTVQKYFDDNESNIRIITEYLALSNYENVYIDAPNGYMLADLKQIQIADNDVMFALKQILTTTGCKHIHKRGNTISLLLWNNNQDVGCGIAYSIDKTTEPIIEFVTQIDSLSSDGWYYYVSE